MSKVCAYEPCKYDVWGDGYCRYHQWMSDKWQKKQKDNAEKRKAKMKLSNGRSHTGIGNTSLIGPKRPWEGSGAVRKPFKKRRATGERELFLKIWEERPHVCKNCKMDLGEEPLTYYFSHIKSKGAWPELRLEPKNIELLCFNCHRLWDQGTRDKFDARKDIYKPFRG